MNNITNDVPPSTRRVPSINAFDGEYTTRHSVYTIRSCRCVEVRDLATGRLETRHLAIGQRLDYVVCFAGTMVFKYEKAEVGDHLAFHLESRGEALVTSPIKRIDSLPAPASSN